ncbi:MAG TPA: hypothetical protein VFS23_33945 [Vicinamibacterales bacterium]|nr:hypothetical protein [Vicinamibacterales bacterium]
MNHRSTSQRPAAVKTLMPVLAVLMLVVATGARAQETAVAADPAANPYGVRSVNAPPELDAFAFFIGKWEGVGKTRLPDGKVVEYPITWIGRYILDGTAIADEGHGTDRDGTRVVGISFRQYDRSRKGWVIEFLAEPNSQFFRQVRPGFGSVTVNGRNVTVINGGRSEAPSWGIIEHYQPAPDNDSWVYRLDESNDGGTSWNEGRTEIILRRSK